MDESPPADAEDAGSIPGQGIKIPHAVGQLSLRAPALSPSSKPLEPQLLKPSHLEPAPCNKRRHHNEKPAHLNWRVAPRASTRESLHSTRDSTAKSKEQIKPIRADIHTPLPTGCRHWKVRAVFNSLLHLQGPS